MIPDSTCQNHCAAVLVEGHDAVTMRLPSGLNATPIHATRMACERLADWLAGPGVPLCNSCRANTLLMHGLRGLSRHSLSKSLGRLSHPIAVVVEIADSRFGSGLD